MSRRGVGSRRGHTRDGNGVGIVCGNGESGGVGSAGDGKRDASGESNESRQR